MKRLRKVEGKILDQERREAIALWKELLLGVNFLQRRKRSI
jgi:hypothetical protein